MAGTGEQQPGRGRERLPTGTVTFLFTDIEGSTRLLQDLGDRYRAVLDEHAAILRRAIQDGGGVEVSTEGDSFFAAFADPVAAVGAAVAAQRGLAGHRWPAGFPVRVRMGLHTGEGTPGGDNYVGIDVNRAARIAAAAAGGQVIVSDATRALVDREVPEGASLRDLGVHRLKDLNLPLRLHDLAIAGLAADFPPPRTLDGRPGNLPAQLTSFVGRERETAEAVRLLERARLLTLTGPGGAGKTRLAVEVADRLLPAHRDGAFFADLSSVTDPALVLPVVARALGIPETAGRPLLQTVGDHLRDKRLLLVIDNFEQVTEAAPVVEELLGAAPQLKVLVTSRAALALRGEQELEVPPLELPDRRRLPDLATLAGSEAVRLFVERAQAVRPAFRLTADNAPAVAEICARLDGLPLAIELAATRVKVLAPAQILPRLQRRLALLTTGARTLPDRQRTLRGAIAWSHDLLPDDERRLFARLSAFAGGWTLESAEAVCDPEGLGLDILDGLASLVDQSLVRRVEPPGRPARFSMLETIREFGQERLDASGELERYRRRHAEHFLGFAVAAEAHLTGPDQGEWLDRCDTEHANLRLALRWPSRSAGPTWPGRPPGRYGGSGSSAATSPRAGSGWRRSWPCPGGGNRHRRGPRPLAGAGGIAWWQEDIPAARAFYEEALAVQCRIGDPAGIADALYNQAFVVAAGGDFDGAFRLFERSRALFREAGDQAGLARAEWMLGIRDLTGGRWDGPLAAAQGAVATWRATGERFQLGDGLVWLAVVYARAGRPADARSALREARDLFREADNLMGMVSVVLGSSYLARWEERYEDALRLAGAAESLREQVGGRAPLDFLAGFLGDPEAESRARLPLEVARRAWSEGRRLELDTALRDLG